MTTIENGNRRQGPGSRALSDDEYDDLRCGGGFRIEVDHDPVGRIQKLANELRQRIEYDDHGRPLEPLDELARLMLEDSQSVLYGRPASGLEAARCIQKLQLMLRL